MKKSTLILISLGFMLITSCGKRPYQAYKTTYKTDRAVQFDDKSVSAEQANKKNIKHMTLQEARAARVYFEQRNDIELIEKVLERIMKLSDNYQERADCLYELATIHLAMGRLEKAREMFEKLIHEYPGVECKKEALYRQILAHYWDCCDAEHDQEMTEKTLSLVKNFLKEFPSETSYLESLETIQDYCYKLLFDAEFLRMGFYVQKYHINQQPESLTAAQMRFTYLVERLLEFQKNISSAAKDALIELCLELKGLEADNISEKNDLLAKAVMLLRTNYEN
ncbi:MAG: tetratricopeptide repeat protein [Candidatus Babeliaceae bacterium]|nr:tetratricopeptide repeat protein [Candidatus Babeliaceae bacterium]